MKHATKTLNPLHFEDLDPHRFEDLVRQLIYDFRDWSNLEPTGRMGSDEGFDARGREIVREYQEDLEIDEEPPVQERIWLIQCKREKSIGPKKLEKYIDDSLKDAREPIYGVIFSAACNFSKKARDAFITKIREYDIKEFQLWGKADLEDLLFQPKNDHLLFVYFGISLKIRQRTTKSRLRAILATKQKAIKCLGDVQRPIHKVTLLRDHEEKRYPYSDEIKDFESFQPWRIFDCVGHYHDGLLFLVRKCFAYLDDDRIHFDYAASWNDSRPSVQDPWNDVDLMDKKREMLWEFWSKIPEQNRAWYEVEGFVPYDKILAIDANGDDWFPYPHIYIPFSRQYGPFEPNLARVTVNVYGDLRGGIYPKSGNRIEHFPKEFRERKG